MANASTSLVVIVTVNWNRLADTLECLRSLAQQTAVNCHTIVVDNGSTDGSLAGLQTERYEAELIANPRNLGFAGGYNVGLRRAMQLGASHVLIVNNDTVAPANLVSTLLDGAEDPSVGIAAPVIYYAAAPERIWSAGAGRSRLLLELTGDHGRAEHLTVPVDREFVSGCAMLIRRAVLEQVGLLDERFFMYYEDSDYCLRVRRAGYRLRVVPAARLWHKVSSSSNGGDSPGERYWMGHSSVLFFRKHVHGLRWLLVLPWRAGSLVKTVARLTLAGRLRAASAYCRGVWAALRT